MRKWFERNKNLLIFFGFTTVITFLLTLLEINLLVSHAKDLEIYAATKEMTDSLRMVSLVGIVNLTLLAFWTLLFMYIFLKIVFPSKRSVRDTLYIDEFRFLKDMPGELRKGLDRK